MRLIRLKEVMSLTGLGRSSVYQFMMDGKFPATVSLGERAVAWAEEEVEAWVLDKIEHRNEKSVSKPKGKTHQITEGDVISFIKNKFKQLTIADAITWLVKVIE